MNGPHLRFMELLREHKEWIAISRSGRVFSLNSHEMDLDVRPGGVRFGFLDAAGYREWNVDAIDIEDRRVRLRLARRFGTVTKSVELIPRMPPEEIGAGVREARLIAANEIASALTAAFPRSRLRRISVEQPRGRFARAVLEEPSGRECGVIADVAGGASAESLLTAAVLWLSRSQRSGKRGINSCRIVAGRGKKAAIRRLHACLARPMRQGTSLLSLDWSSGPASLREIEPMAFEDLWNERPPVLRPPTATGVGLVADEVCRAAGDCADRLFQNNGVTVRFRGLPFARSRTLGGREGLWFGTGKGRELLQEANRHELDDLIAELRAYRRHDSPNKQHLFYLAAPEAWLESVLRRDIARIDPTLEVSPVYNQFRSSRDRIDLLAVSRQGRVVIVEVKVSADPTVVFQAADYWRRIELQRRTGLLASAGVFSGRRLADDPARVLIAAPATCFREDTETLVRSLRSEISIGRVELAEDWRREIKVTSLR